MGALRWTRFSISSWMVLASGLTWFSQVTSRRGSARRGDLLFSGDEALLESVLQQGRKASRSAGSGGG
jgi:hypothetical protein